MALDLKKKKKSIMYTCNLFSEGIVNWFCMVRLYLAPLPVVFLRQEYWSGLSFLFPGDLPNPGIEPGSPCIAGRFFTV